MSPIFLWWILFLPFPSSLRYLNAVVNDVYRRKGNVETIRDGFLIHWSRWELAFFFPGSREMTNAISVRRLPPPEKRRPRAFPPPGPFTEDECRRGAGQRRRCVRLPLGMPKGVRESENFLRVRPENRSLNARERENRRDYTSTVKTSVITVNWRNTENCLTM